MKKNLLKKIILLGITVFLASVSGNAKNRIYNADDLQKYQQLKEYVNAHPVASGQTSEAINMLKKFGTVAAKQDAPGHATARTHSTNSSAFVPVNDDCANAILLTEGTTCVTTQGDVAAATESMPASICGIYTSTNGYDVWYQFVAVTASPFITVTGSSSFDAVVFLFDACGGAELACADATVSGQSEVISATGLIPGNTYFIRVYDYGSALPTTTTFDICVQGAPAPPANDACANATSLTMGATCNTVSATLGGATDDGITGCSGTADDDVWFSFVSTSTDARIAVSSLEVFNTVIEIFDGCGGSSLYCIDNNTDGNESADISLISGNTYFVRVFTFDVGGAVPGNFDICVREIPPPSVNDTMCGAISLVLDGAVESGDISFATPTEYPGDSIVTAVGYGCSVPNNTMWYTYTAATTDSFYVNYTAFDSFDGWLGIFSSDNAATPCAGNLTYIDCPSAAFQGTQTFGFLPDVAGEVYLFMVDGVSGSVGPFSISVTSPTSALGIAHVVNNSVFSLYPNPSKGSLTLHLKNTTMKSTIRLYDVIGNLLTEEVIQNTNETKIDASAFSSGVYFIKVENENGLFTQKIMLSK